MAERVRVVEVISETADAKSFVLELPWTYRPGQFVTVRAGDVARSYSLASSPHTGEAPKITVKRAGSGSNWLCDNVEAGTELDMLPPGGVFTPSSLDRDLLLFAGGSGITPVMSIVKSALSQGTGKVLLVYANRDRSSIIFAEELAALECERFKVVHWLDSERGWPTADSVREMSAPFAGYEKFVCGPDPFMDVIEEALGTVHSERFVSLAENPFAAPEEPVEKFTKLEVAIDGQSMRSTGPFRPSSSTCCCPRGFSRHTRAARAPVPRARAASSRARSSCSTTRSSKKRTSPRTTSSRARPSR
jgi:3-ketosteroid 9alpha-monooxygenase subunit B